MMKKRDRVAHVRTSNSHGTSDRRIPPHSKMAEEAVLGAMMLEREAVLRMARLLPHDGEAFYYEAHAEIFRAMMTLNQRNKPVDIVTLNDELRLRGTLGETGGSHYLAELNMRTPTAANVEHHGRIVLERHFLREVIRQFTSLVETAYADGADALEVVDRAAEIANRLCERRHGGRTHRMIGEVLDQAVAEIREAQIARRDQRQIGILTGYPEIDQRTGGLAPGDLAVLGARPSMGKSALMWCIATNVARAGHRVLTISLEMRGEQLVIRGLAEDMQVDSLALRTGDFREPEEAREAQVTLTWKRIEEAVARMRTLPIILEERGAQTFQQLAARARIHHRQAPLGLIVVDYMQLMEIPEEESREREVAKISRGLKLLAKELGLPIIVLSQLNRAVEMRKDKRPMLSDLRESGAVEQDSDVVMFVYRPAYYGETVDANGESLENVAEVIIAKARNGHTGTAELYFDPPTCAFRNLDRKHSVVSSPPSPPVDPQQAFWFNAEDPF